MTSQVLCFQHHSRPWDQNDFVKRSNQMSWTITSIRQLNATLPGQNSGPIWLLVGSISRLRLSRYHLW